MEKLQQNKLGCAEAMVAQQGSKLIANKKQNCHANETQRLSGASGDARPSFRAEFWPYSFPGKWSGQGRGGYGARVMAAVPRDTRNCKHQPDGQTLKAS